MDANQRSFSILTEWMPNGNVTQYAKSNPKANRLRLVRPPIVPVTLLTYRQLVFSCPRPYLAWHTFTSSILFTEISSR